MPKTPTETASRRYTVRQLKQAAYNAGFRGHNLVIAVAVSLAENQARDPRAVNVNSNGSVDRGAWQINSIHGFSGNPYDLQTNALMAYSVWRSQGWSAWTVYKNKSFKSRLSEAQRAPIRRNSNNQPAGLLAGITPGQAPTIDSDDDGGNWVDDLLPGDGLPDIPGFDVPNPLSWKDGLGQIFDTILSVDFWKRFGLVMLAVAIAVAGIVIMITSNKTARQAVELAATKGMVSE